ncbi:MAG: hypothetical protein A3G33_00910 [Omnitrophica bacterium RIFCSPLOWO2_12_FULL_44_17]|uniref:TPM domain-containing protein n=1 Tax=Candidatus Danuiimicrobium aquiferis TaxID=1801832 RepID=A0A1G1L3J3_9BACT|nr:MAG: hypothetical protein A3B72_06390 [Omnitrophica bacterium RIFCSPHIGHO2_02_FULL_45_28]OGW89807.1 MAG: hypothetical protein A3E74_10145 [Omnitrophica bacterium RIFCSPHIGHO2_12_FULL_44_12]OGW99439.1 MAG: hypothetical protein A3G33_00910 [Omnitrophica bacterium RIFCSPLOWO2_12_FULL_44_17]OGX03050.1 MAG: hypothetical protein A3J12_04895 [Omnitrophica bacterium RIFCSPLOWO2_02_FULL_44_11]
MKSHFILKSSILLIFALSLSSKAFSEEFPERKSYVNDFSDMLSNNTKKSLEKYLQDFEDITTHQILVATFPTYDDNSMESFGSQLASAWKIGYKDQGNGMILIIFEKEHRAWIQVGFGLEEKISYSFTRKLIRDVIAPRFRDSEYNRGVSDAVQMIVQKIAPNTSLSIINGEKQFDLSTKAKYVLLILLLITIIVDLLSYVSYRLGVKHASATYQRQVETYSFLEWWLLYGTIISFSEFIYFNLFIRWTNPSFLLSSSGYRKGYLRPGSGRGRFLGSGISGNW